MGSPRRNNRDQEGGHGDIRDRLQALAKSGSEGRRGNNVMSVKLQSNVNRSSHDQKRDKFTGHRDSMGHVMERARTEGGNRWTKKLLDEEAKNPERWGHSGFKEMYKNELGLKNHRSRSRDRGPSRRSRSLSRSRNQGATAARRSRSLSRSNDKLERQPRPKERESLTNRSRSGGSRNPLRSSSRERGVNGWRLVKGSKNEPKPEHQHSQRGHKRGHSSSVDRSPMTSNRAPMSNRPRKRGDEEQRREVHQKVTIGGAGTRDLKSTKSFKGANTGNGSQNKIGAAKNARKQPVRRMSRSRSRSPDHHHTEDPVGKNRLKMLKRVQVSATERSPLSASSASPGPRRHRRSPFSDRSSRSASSSSHSASSKSPSSSSGSGYSSSSSRGSSKAGHSRTSTALAVSAQTSSPARPAKAKLVKNKSVLNANPSTTRRETGSVPAKNDTLVVSKAASDTRSKPMSSSSTKRENANKYRQRSDSETSSNASSSDSEEEEDDEMEEAEDHQEFKSDRPTRVSLSERFGKLAQLSSQRRSLELVQLRIVAPVGGTNNNEKNVSVDSSSAAPVISRSKEDRIDSPPLQQLQQKHIMPDIRNHVSPDVVVRRPEHERVREDRWRDWHERYDQYQHVQPPRQLPRDWGDIRVRHKYYTERGYFNHDMTYEELSRWEAWWHRYQQWRRGYERAWVAAHGPHIPVEYPDWSHYRTNNRSENPLTVSAGSIRNRLGWRR